MTTNELTLFSYEILGLVGRGEVGPHDLRRMVHQGRMLDWAGESQYYTEPKRLAKLGYLDAHKAPGKTRERTVYSLTEKGLQALREYARTPVAFQPLKSELLIRLLICDLVGEETTLQAVQGLREEIADLEARLDDSERNAATLPHRAKYLLLAFGFLRRVLDLHLDFIAQLERELGPSSRRAGVRRSKRSTG
jgi:DNA-binding PadR family transcriptional regulator